MKARAIVCDGSDTNRLQQLASDNELLWGISGGGAVTELKVARGLDVVVDSPHHLLELIVLESSVSGAAREVRKTFALELSSLGSITVKRINLACKSLQGGAHLAPVCSHKSNMHANMDTNTHASEQSINAGSNANRR